VVDRVPAMLAYWDRDQRCRFANGAYEKWFGVSPEAVVGMSMKELLGPLYPLNQHHIENALGGEEQEFEREFPDPAPGPARYVQVHYIPDVVGGVVQGFCALVTDITRRKRAEESLQAMQRQLEARERLAAMATLAAGVAHEINNPLAAVLGNVELALGDLDATSPDTAAARRALLEARDGALRMREIVRSMRLLGGGVAAQRERVNLADCIEQSLAFASNTLRYHARLESEIEPGLFVDANAAQLAQVFVNLLANAARAVPEGSPRPGVIRVSSRRQGDQLVSEVADNGCGIPEALQSRIFEPFFSTQEVGEGMGLGLSISRGIVEGLGGKISVESQPGQGSVFRVVLPAAKAEAPVSPVTVLKSDASEVMRAARVHQRLLIVDDEPSISAVLKRLLVSDGYDVTVAHGGREALALLSAAGERRFDLILCDLMMPELSGEDLFREVTHSRPALASRFLFMTGGAFTPRGQQFLASLDTSVLEKPFVANDVRRLVSARLRAVSTQRDEAKAAQSA